MTLYLSVVVVMIGPEASTIRCLVSTSVFHAFQRFARGWGREGGVRRVVAPGFLVGDKSFVAFAGFRARWTFLRVVVISFVRLESVDVCGGVIPCQGRTFVFEGLGSLGCILGLFVNAVTCKLKRLAR